ncbi:MAG: Mu-like prophage major head subunit gpT family protein [Piscinibacter sp.]|nr:Mu-like prophage major head subunit gpT family protein [Piscinibacter sp.]
MIINQSNLTLLYQAFKTAFNTGFRTNEQQWGRIATLVPSSTKSEQYGWLGQFPKLREWIGDRQVKNMAASSYAITNKSFESTIGVNRDDIEDDQYGVYTPLFQEMGFAAATHPDELVFALLAAGFTTNCYDGQFFFDSDHPVGSGVVSNSGGGAGTPWYLLDVRRPLKPLIFQRRKDYNMQILQDEKDEAVFMRKEYRYGVDARCNVGFGFWQQAYGSKQTLDATNYSAARTAMMSLKSDEGRPLGIKPNLLVVPPSLESAALTLLQAEKNANGADNIYRNTAELIVVPWLA